MLLTASRGFGRVMKSSHMKKLSTVLGRFCDWQINQLNQSSWYGKLQLLIGTFMALFVAIASLWFAMPQWLLWIVWYKTGTLLLIIFVYITEPKGWRDSIVGTLSVMLHLIDVIIVAPFKRA